MMKSGKSKLIVLAWVAVNLLGVQSARAQTNAPSVAQMAVFRACLARAENRDDSKAGVCATPIYDSCTRTYDVPNSTIAMSECTMRQSQAWDTVLNNVWPITLNKLSPGAKTKLRVAQRIWITSRKADCDATYEAYIDGTMRSIVYSGCMSQTTMKRYFWLKNFYGE